MSPWGKIDQVTKYATGFSFIGTPRHGGFRVSLRRLQKQALNPEKIMQLGGIAMGQYVFFEEDCAYCLYLLDAPNELRLFAQYIGKNPDELFVSCKRQVQNWFPKYFINE